MSSVLAMKRGTTVLRALGWMSALIAAAAAADTKPAVQQTAAIAAWVKEHAVPLRTIEPGGDDSDLQVVGSLIGVDTRVIGFGEAAHHRTPEPLTLRNRLFMYFVEHHGVTAYAGETSLTGAVAVDEYLTQGGPLTDEIIDAVYIAVPGEVATAADSKRALIQQRRQSRQLIEWMRAYNRRPTTQRPLRFYGFDPCPRANVEHGYRTGCMQPALRDVLDYVRRVQPSAAAHFERRLSALQGFYFYPAPAKSLTRTLTAAERNDFTAAIADLQTLFAMQEVSWTRKSSSVEYHRAHGNVVVVQQLDAAARMNLQGPASEDVWESTYGKDSRDAAMAQNVLRILEREGPQGRIFIFAHGTHLDKFSKNPTALASDYVAAGEYLHAALGSRFTLLGCTGIYAAPAGVAAARLWAIPAERSGIDTLLDAVGQPLLFLDARAAPALKTGLSGSNREPWRLQDSFDAMLFVKPLTLPRKVD